MSTSKKSLDRLFESELYLYFHEEILDDQRTKDECGFIERHCKIGPKTKILDLACGHGRHSNYFGSKDLKVCGIDMNSSFIEMAKEESALRKLSVEYLEENILEISYLEEFDVVLLLFNTLGFFNRNDANKLLSKISDSLKIGGRALIDIKNRDHVMKELRNCSVWERGEDLMIDRLSFNPKEGKTLNRRIYIKAGKRYDVPFEMNMYNYTDIERLTQSNGLKIDQVYGSWRGEEFNEDSRRILLIVEKEN